MDSIRTIQLKESILQNNDADAEKLRAELDKAGVYYVNVMSAPGSGKTTLLVALTKALKDKVKIGVMEADIDRGCLHRARSRGGSDPTPHGRHVPSRCGYVQARFQRVCHKRGYGFP